MTQETLKFRVSIIIILMLATISLGQYSGGNGTKTNPWRIANKEDLLNIGKNTGHFANHFLMTADVNLDNEVYTTALIANDISRGSGFQGTAFSGVFDGNNFKITGLTIDDSGAGNYYLGLFGSVDGGQIKNLGIENNYVRGNGNFIGGLAGWNNGNISNCYSNGFLMGGDFVGGLIGYNSDSIAISNCYSQGDVFGSGNYVGGFIGYNYKCDISNCYSSVSTLGLKNCVGGLIGYSDNSSISYCYSISDVNGIGNYIGGLVGNNLSGIIFSSYFIGNVIGYDYVGGLVGYYSPSGTKKTISNCYSKGDLIGMHKVGGLTGYNYGGNILNCYSNMNINGFMDMGCLAGNNFGSSSISNSFWNAELQSHGVNRGIGFNSATVTNIVGLTISQMQKKITYKTSPSNWDFDSIWTINEGINYPELRCQKLRGDLVYPDGVDYHDFVALASAWYSQVGDDNWNAVCDIAEPKDGIINQFDLAALAENWLNEI